MVHTCDKIRHTEWQLQGLRECARQQLYLASIEIATAAEYHSKHNGRVLQAYDASRLDNATGKEMATMLTSPRSTAYHDRKRGLLFMESDGDFEMDVHADPKLTARTLNNWNVGKWRIRGEHGGRLVPHSTTPSSWSNSESRPSLVSPNDTVAIVRPRSEPLPRKLAPLKNYRHPS